MRESHRGGTTAAWAEWSGWARDHGRGGHERGSVGRRAEGLRAEADTELDIREAEREARGGAAEDRSEQGRARVAAETDRPFGEHAAESVPLVGEWLAGKLYGTARNAAPDAEGKKERDRTAVPWAATKCLDREREGDDVRQGDAPGWPDPAPRRPHVGSTGALGDHRLRPRGRPLPHHGALHHHDRLRMAPRRHGDPRRVQALDRLLSPFGPDARVAGGTEDRNPDRGHRRGPENRTDTQAHARDGLLQGMGGRGMGSGRHGVCTLGFWMLGRRLARTRRVRGAEMATARELRRRVQPLSVRVADGPVSGSPAGVVPHRRDPLAPARRDPAHHRLGHHGLGQDRADIRPGRPDPGAGGTLHRLRQDGDLYAVLLRSRHRHC